MLDIIQGLLIPPKKPQEQIDLLKFLINDLKKNGFFIEFGAHDGLFRSHTYILEHVFHWTGILCEPIPSLIDQCKFNRPNSKVENKCVWSTTGELLEFREAQPHSGLSTIKEFITVDEQRDSRAGVNYFVETISLVDLLDKHNAPKIIDYFVIDTEGSEFEILNAFDFSKYQFNIINCEHNYTKSRPMIYNLLVSKGYKRMFDNLSKNDDWYIRQDLF